MKAKKKPVEKISAADLGVDLTPRLETLKVSEPPKRLGGGKVNPVFCYHPRLELTNFTQVDNVNELIANLKEAGITAVKV